MNIAAILPWLEAHPVIIAQVVVPLATALFTWLLKPRTEAEYEAMGPRVAGLHKIVAGLGIDAPKLVDGLMLLVLKKRSARSIPPPPPAPKLDPALDRSISITVVDPEPPSTKPEL